MSRMWTPEENEALHKLWRNGMASRKTLMKAIPGRNWKSILDGARKRGLPSRVRRVNFWTIEEQNALCLNWGSIGSDGDWSVIFPDKTAKVIVDKATRIGLRQCVSGIFWSEEEDVLLKAFWFQDLPIKVWEEKIPGRGFRAIQDRARNLKLGKRNRIGKSNFSYVDASLTQVLGRVPMMTISQLSAETGHSVAQIRKILVSRDYHIEGWIRLRAHGKIEARWALGKGENEPMPCETSHFASLRAFRESKKIAGKGNHFAVLINQLAA